MTKVSKPKITTVTFEEFTDMEFKAPSAYFIRDAMGEYKYFHCRDRATAQNWCNDLYGVGQYTVNSGRMSKPPESQSAVGRINSKSRAGSRSVK